MDKPAFIVGGEDRSQRVAMYDESSIRLSSKSLRQHCKSLQLLPAEGYVNRGIFSDTFSYWVNMKFAEKINSYKVDGKSIAYSLTTSLDEGGENPRFTILVYSPKTSAFLTVVFVFVYGGENYLYIRKWAKPALEANSYKSTAEFLLREFSNANLDEIIQAYYFVEYRTSNYYIHEINFK